MSFYDNYLDNGTRVQIKVNWGTESIIVGGVIDHYIGNGQYVVERDNGNCYVRHLDDIRTEKPAIDHETLNAEGQTVRERWAVNAEHDSNLLESGPIYTKDGVACPECGQDSYRAVGDCKFECGDCHYYFEY